jgi:3-deoxy-D-manno-octulosonic-acid transferase
MGILADAYLRSVVGVVCGTFAPIGGHDLSEPLQQGAAAVYGPHVARQYALDEALRGADAATPVADAAQLPAAVSALIADPDTRAARRARFAELVHDMERRLEHVALELKEIAERERP